MLDFDTDASAHLHPEIHLVADRKSLGQLHGDHMGGTVIGCDTSDQKSAIVRTAVTHHIPALPFFHICGCKITIEYLCQMCTVGVVNGFSPNTKVMVNRLTVCTHNRRNVFRPLHTPFNFERVNARIKQLRDEFNRIQIARGKEKVARSVTKHIISLCIYQCIGQTAGLCTASAIPTATTDHAAHQTLSRIADTERTMHETLDLHTAFFANLTNLWNGEFACQHHT